MQSYIEQNIYQQIKLKNVTLQRTTNIFSSRKIIQQYKVVKDITETDEVFTQH